VRVFGAGYEQRIGGGDAGAQVGHGGRQRLDVGIGTEVRQRPEPVVDVDLRAGGRDPRQGARDRRARRRRAQAAGDREDLHAPMLPRR